MSAATTDLFDVRGKVALVTGGSRGIGLMMADALVRAGAEVIISSRKADDCARAVEGLAQHGRATAIPADVSTPEGARELAAAVGERTERLHLLFNNAGATWGAPIEEFPPAGFDKVLDLNVKGVFHLTVALLDRLRAAATPQDPARVVNVGSVDGLRVPAMESYSYSASKAAVHMLTRHLAKRLAGEAITVNAIAPGPFESKMTAFMLQDEASRDAVASTVPLGRIGTPDDIAGVTLLLSSRAGAYLTGVVLPVDGGITGCG
ncbi:SDR family oxidoreductase [Conexibacter sp. SYSU D00693]|uniref:SDR family oxidoreductase n=1 Tax=Conexibacter sp. SYSU D00693 TaxID=2812560 RepID=UPI00196AB8B0|nr:SDR family oxidoreductase [Conexibacter sp. SYSU D00693]